MLLSFLRTSAGPRASFPFPERPHPLEPLQLTQATFTLQLFTFNSPPLALDHLLTAY